LAQRSFLWCGELATKLTDKLEDGGNRTRLLQSAADTFAETGYEGTSLRLIAENAHVSFQLISYYFGSKDDLWRATVGDLFDRYVESGKLTFTVSSDIHDQFRGHLRFLLAHMLERPQLRKIWIQEHLAGGERYEQVIKPKVRQLHEKLSLPYFTEVVRLGIVTRFSPEETAIIWGAIVQLNVVYPYYLELLVGFPTGSAKSIDAQVDLAYRVLAGDAFTALDHGHLEIENKHLRELVATLSLEKKILAEALRKRDEPNEKSGEVSS
jgi:AcrR family transcriptional regulator